MRGHTNTYSQIVKLIAVVDHGSQRNAAKALGVTGQAVSLAMIRLEADVGVPLLEGTGPGRKPTPTAKALARALRAHVAGIESYKTLARDLDAAARAAAENQ